MVDRYIRLYGKRLYGLCLTLCGFSADADDLYQETWLKAYKNIDRYDSSRDFEPWLTAICVNTYRNSLRRIKRSPVFDYFSSNEKKDAVLNAEATSPIEVAGDYSALYEAIDGLPDKLRLTVILFYFKDMDVKAAATLLGIPTGTVRSRLSKARNMLKEALTDETDLRL